MSTTNPPERYFQHCKGGLYRYITVAKDSETLENIVVYQALYGEYIKILNKIYGTSFPVR